MKLIDLLVQELPKRGGWPDGYRALVQGHSGAVYLAGGGMPLWKFELAEDWGLAEVTREQYEAALAAAQQPVWNGERLPPVGCECEVVDIDGMLMYGQGESGKVVAHVENTAVIRMSYGLGCFESRFLRPIRSEADRKREEVVTALAKAGGDVHFEYGRKTIDGELSSPGWYKLYDKIAAGEIAGIRIE